MNLKVLSWNIWQGHYFSEVMDYIKKQKPDLVGLQEVIEKDGSSQAEQLATQLGYEFCYFRAVNRTRLGFPQGNAILSKFKLDKASAIILNQSNIDELRAESEPRIAVAAEINVGGKNLEFITTHLAYSHRFSPSKYRDAQLATLTKHLKRERFILAGDLNSLPESDIIEKLNQVLVNTDPNLEAPTWTIYPFDYNGFKEDRLMYRLDYIFVSRDIKFKDFEIGDSKGSDHLPILVTIEI